MRDDSGRAAPTFVDLAISHEVPDSMRRNAITTLGLESDDFQGIHRGLADHVPADDAVIGCLVPSDIRIGCSINVWQGWSLIDRGANRLFDSEFRRRAPVPYTHRAVVSVLDWAAGIVLGAGIEWELTCADLVLYQPREWSVPDDCDDVALIGGWAHPIWRSETLLRDPAVLCFLSNYTDGRVHIAGRRVASRNDRVDGVCDIIRVCDDMSWCVVFPQAVASDIASGPLRVRDDISLE